MRILAVFAHPDDESFLCAGTFLKYTQAGHQVYLICATRGEQGEIIHPEIEAEAFPKGPARGKLRQGELETACQVMGIEPPVFLDYEDSGYPITVAQGNPKAFMNCDTRALEDTLLSHIHRIQPQAMIGFDPQGAYGHIDHLVIHRATLAAFWRANDPAPQRLFFPVRTRSQFSSERLDPNIYGVSEASLAVRLDVRVHAETMRQALLAHRSQIGLAENLAKMERDWPGMFAEETYVLGGLRGSFPAMPTDDLLAGLA